MKNKTLLLTLCALYILTCQYSCTSIGERELSGDGMTSQMDIKGYKPFVIFQSRYLLGSVVAEQNIWRDPIYRGRPTHNPVSGEYAIEYSKNQLTEAKVALEGVVNVEGALEKFQSVKLILENPEEFQFEKICIPIKDKDNAELRKLKYISALLKAKRIRIEFLAKDGTKIDTEADLKKYNLQLGAKVQKEEKVAGIYFAENTFVGYKLSDPKETIGVCPDQSNAKVLVLPFKWISKIETDEDYARMLRFEAENVLNTISLKFNKQLIKVPTGNVLAEAERYINSKDKEDYHTNLIAEYSSRTDANLILTGKFIRHGKVGRITVEFKDNAGNPSSTQYIDYTLNDLDKANTSPSSFIKEWNVKVSESFQSTLQESQIVKVVENSEAYNEYVKGIIEAEKLEEDGFKKAMHHFEKTIELDSKSAKAHAMLAETISKYSQTKYNTQLKLSDREKREQENLEYQAESHLKTALELNNEDYLVYRAYSNYYFTKSLQKENFNVEEHRKKASAYADKALSLNPKDSSSSWLSFFIKAESDKRILNDQSNLEFKKATELNSNSFESILNVARVMATQGETDKAIDYYKIALTKSPSHLPAKFELARLYRQKNNFNESQKILEEMEVPYPKDYRVKSALAEHYRDKIEYEKTESYFVKILNDTPEDFIEVAGDIEFFYLQFHTNPKRGIALFEKAIKLDSQNKDIYLSYIGNLEADKKKSLEYFEKSLDIRLKNKDTSQLLVGESYSDIANAYNVLGLYSKAIEFNLKALDIYLRYLGESHFRTAFLYNELGVSYFELRDYDKALTYFKANLDILLKKLGETNPSIAGSYINIGAVFEVKKDFAQYIAYTKKAENIFISNFGNGYRALGLCYSNLIQGYKLNNEPSKTVLYYSKLIDLEINKGVDVQSIYSEAKIFAKEKNKLRELISLFKENANSDSDHKKWYESRILELEKIVTKSPSPEDRKNKSGLNKTGTKENLNSMATQLRIHDLKTSLNEKNFVAVNLEIAKLYQESEEPLTAIVYYEKILEKDPKNEIVNLELGKHYFKKKNPIKAEQYISVLEKKHKEKLLSEDNKVRAEAYLGLAKIAKLLGNISEEKEYLKTRESILKMK